MESDLSAIPLFLAKTEDYILVDKIPSQSFTNKLRDLGFEIPQFITKKKAISSIQDDYNNFGFSFDITIINNESLHKVVGKYDILVSDE